MGSYSCLICGSDTTSEPVHSCPKLRKSRKLLEAERAKVVRDALNAVSVDSQHCGWWGALAERETDAVLVKLWRLLR